jgi:hypothetical protein
MGFMPVGTRLVKRGFGSEGGRRGELGMIGSWSFLAYTAYCVASGEKPSPKSKNVAPAMTERLPVADLRSTPELIKITGP